MLKTICWILSTWSLLTIIPKSTMADDALVNGKIFIEQYKKNSKGLRDFYENTIADFVVTKNVFSRNDEFHKLMSESPKGAIINLPIDRKEISRVHFEGNGGRFRFDTESDQGSIEAYVTSPQLSFRVGKKRKNQDFNLNEIYTDNNDAFVRYNQTMRRVCLGLMSPYSVLRQDLIDFVSQGKFSVDSTSEYMRDNQKVILVSWRMSRPIPGKAPVAYSGEFHFLPDFCWALKEFSLRWSYSGKDSIPQSPGTLAILNYKDYIGNIPLLRDVKYYNFGRGGIIYPASTVEFNKLERGSAPEEDFVPEAFGIDTQPARAPTPVWKFLFPIFVVCLLLAILLKFLKSRFY